MTRRATGPWSTGGGTVGSTSRRVQRTRDLRSGASGAAWSSSEAGDIITGWLFRLLAFLAVVAFVALEIGTVVVANFSLDDTAREVARAARDEYRGERSLDRATQVAADVAERRDAEVVAVVEDGDDLVIELRKRAPTVVVHRIGPLEEFTKVTASSRIAWTL